MDPSSCRRAKNSNIALLGPLLFVLYVCSSAQAPWHLGLQGITICWCRVLVLVNAVGHGMRVSKFPVRLLKFSKPFQSVKRQNSPQLVLTGSFDVSLLWWRWKDVSHNQKNMRDTGENEESRQHEANQRMSVPSRQLLANHPRAKANIRQVCSSKAVCVSQYTDSMY